MVRLGRGSTRLAFGFLLVMLGLVTVIRLYGARRGRETQLTISVYGMVTRRNGKNSPCDFLVEMQDPRHCLKHRVLLHVHKLRVLFTALQSRAQIV